MVDKSPAYILGTSSTMTHMLWNLTRVTVREDTEEERKVNNKIIEKELSNLWWISILYIFITIISFSKLSHPNILLLMGVCTGRDDKSVKLIFEQVHLGSLYHLMHEEVGRGPIIDISHMTHHIEYSL